MHGLEVSLPMRVAFAAQACLLILDLDTGNWIEVIPYPGAFCVQREHTDAIGLVQSNVVLHEFAHKLDGLNGAINGLP